MHGPELSRFIVGVIGNVVSGLMFLAPVPTYWRICKKKSTEGFHPYPYLATVMNCLFWIFYGLPIVHPDSTLVVTINSAGLVLQLSYLTIFFIFSSSKKFRVHIFLILFVEVVFLAAMATITLLCFHTHTKRSMFVGLICVIFGIIMYGAPLSVLRKVVKTKSAEFLPIWLCFAGFANGIIWFSYANLKVFDLYIAIPNGMGAILGLVQLLLYAYYTCKGSAKDDVKPGQVQLQNRPQV